ncbi:unnamed protein product, partial [Hymenolepis diminuta]
AAEVNPAGGKRESKNGFAINTPVYARDYRLSRQWTIAIITNGHRSIIYDGNRSGYGSVAYSSNKIETFLSPVPPVLEDLRVICLRREILEEMTIIFPPPNVSSMSKNVISFFISPLVKDT